MKDYNRSSQPIKKVVLMADPTIGSIPIRESDEALVPLVPSEHLTIDPSFGELDTRYIYVRKSVADGLYRAARTLPRDIEIRFYEGWRSRKLQERYFYEFLRSIKPLYPTATQEQLHRLASRYVSPPWIVPPHVTGAAVDLTLAFVNGAELDMGTEINESPEESRNRCYMDSPNITAEARANRTLLATTLTSQGFANYPTEWWHWSKGDQYWSYVFNTKYAIYGETEPLIPY